MTTNLLDFLEAPMKEGNIAILSISLDKDFCRCCHSKGSFLSLEGAVVNDQGEEECFKDLLRDFLDSHLPKVEGKYQNVTYKICTLCVWKLREAIAFKTQVLNCEEKFREFFQQTDIETYVPLQEEDESEFNVSKVRDDDEISMDAEVLDEFLSDEDCEIPVDNIGELPPTSDGRSSAAPVPHFLKPLISGRASLPRLLKEKKTSYAEIKKPRKYTRKTIINEPSNTEIEKSKKKLTKKTQLIDGTSNKYDKYNVNKLRANRSKEQEEYKINEDGSFKCCRCDTVKQKYKEIVKHVTIEHKDDVTDFLPAKGFQEMFDSTRNGKYKCYICDKLFGQKSYVLIHVEKIHFKLKRLYCEICDLRFSSDLRLIAHKFQIHQIDKRVNCNACEKKFFGRQSLYNHIENHHMMKTTNKCQHCGFHSYSHQEMRRHRLTHRPPKVFKCSDCGLLLKNNNALNKHRFVHKTTKDYSCRFCKKSFKRKTTLKLHEKIHTGEKNKICKECGEGFVQKASLNYHMGKYHPEVPF